LLENLKVVDLTLFQESDRKEVIKFVINKLSFALFDSIPKDKLFDSIDVNYSNKYYLWIKSMKHTKRNFMVDVYGKKFELPFLRFGTELFHDYGLNSLSKQAIDRIKNNDFLDCGASVESSAIILSNFKPKNVYSFEPDIKNYEILLNTIESNIMNCVIPINMGVGGKSCEVQMNMVGNASEISKTVREKIKIISIDEFAKIKKLHVGLIKLDVEGYELEVIKGAKKTITKHKSILLISVYHKGQDFFEIPILLKKLVPKYKYRFININHDYPYFERLLIAYS
ncbi:MAG: FkbM family methyltransferase, partial [Nanoarchaeota archaeon]|nr:FkbM family methyltransferase [Nanoarchaeota archaeon]